MPIFCCLYWYLQIYRFPLWVKVATDRGCLFKIRISSVRMSIQAWTDGRTNTIVKVIKKKKKNVGRTDRQTFCPLPPLIVGAKVCWNYCKMSFVLTILIGTFCSLLLRWYYFPSVVYEKKQNETKQKKIISLSLCSQTSILLWLKKKTLFDL